MSDGIDSETTDSAGGGSCAAVAIRPEASGDLREVRQVCEDLVGRHAEVDQAGDLVDANVPHALDEAAARIEAPEQAARGVVALERVVEQRVHLFGREIVGIELALRVRRLLS